MNAKQIFRMSFATVLSILVAGCAMPISKNLRDMADPALTFEQVKQNPDAYESKVVGVGRRNCTVYQRAGRYAHRNRAEASGFRIDAQIRRRNRGTIHGDLRRVPRFGSL